jgi:DNA segregation ATPase FtsK/SpoIIIE-like protein
MKQNENEIILEALCEMNDRLSMLAKKQDSLHSDLNMALHGLETKIDRLSNVRTLRKPALPIIRESVEEEYKKAKRIVAKAGEVSASYLQKALDIGDSKTLEIMKMLEERGVIKPAQEKLEPSAEFSRKLGARYAKTSHILKKAIIAPIKKHKKTIHTKEDEK